MEAQSVSEDASELTQAVLPEDQAVSFASKGKVFQTGQIWSFCSGLDDLPLYYGKIQKITPTHEVEPEAVYKLYMSRLNATAFPSYVIKWEDKKMPVGCGTFCARKAQEVITSDDLSQQIFPEISMDGKQFTILPKIGDVWVIYRFWSQYQESERLGFGSYDIVEILDDTSGYKVLLLEQKHVSKEGEDEDESMFFKAVTEYKYNEIEGSEPIFTIPKSEMLRFSHKAPAFRVTIERYGKLEDLIKVDSEALPHNLRYSDMY